MASHPMSSGSLSSFGGLGRSQIGSNVPSQQSNFQLGAPGASIRRYSTPPNYTYAFRAGQAPEASAGRQERERAESSLRCPGS